jgi:hypothetical protein
MVDIWMDLDFFGKGTGKCVNVKGRNKKEASELRMKKTGVYKIQRERERERGGVCVHGCVKEMTRE